MAAKLNFGLLLIGPLGFSLDGEAWVVGDEVCSQFKPSVLVAIIVISRYRLSLK